MSVAYIGIGSNLGDRLSFFKRAIELLAVSPDIKVEIVSSLYETQPIGFKDQPLFLNAVIKLSTELSPKELFSLMQSVEKNLGRERRERWGPRTIDLDLLLYDDIVLMDQGLTVPHPRLTERMFVLVPLSEIAPDLVHPVLKMRVAEILACGSFEGSVTLYKQKVFQP